MNNKIIIVGRIFPLYRKAVFDLLQEKVDLTVLHGKNHSGIKAASTAYSEQIPHFQYGKKETNVLLFPLFKILKYRPRVVICELAMGILNIPILMIACKLLKIKFVFWSHGYNRKTGFEPKKRLIDKYRLLLLRSADANIIYSEVDKELLGKFLPKDKIFVAQNTIDTTHLVAIRQRLELEGKINIKKRLDIDHTVNLTFISRMLRSKKPDLLINIYEILKSKYKIRAGIHFIGDGEMLPVIQKEVESKGYAEDFYFHGSIHDDILNGELLYISDCMVMPGYLGLSVNYAFCFDCPVISFLEKEGYPAHSPEVEYVINNKTGFLVEAHTAEAMAGAVNFLITSHGLNQEITSNIRNSVNHKFPLEKMVDGVLDCLSYLEKPASGFLKSNKKNVLL